jgi:hypothetical protein
MSAQSSLLSLHSWSSHLSGPTEFLCKINAYDKLQRTINRIELIKGSLANKNPSGKQQWLGGKMIDFIITGIPDLL